MGQRLGEGHSGRHDGSRLQPNDDGSGLLKNIVGPVISGPTTRAQTSLAADAGFMVKHTLEGGFW